ncbi:beta-N-acetylhexosaminidase [Tepidimicrobium xylanilyticum]
MKKICIFILLVVILSGCTRSNNSNNMGREKRNEDAIIDEEDKTEEEDMSEERKDNIKKVISNMTLEEKIGQLLIIGIEDTEVDDHVRKMIEEYKVGGFILFKHNISNADQATELLNSLKSLNKKNPIPLFLSIDEEGGRVSRLPNTFPKLPPAKKIGKVNDESISLQYGKIIGKRIKSLGFNINFAPVLDIDSNPNNPVIGDRAFGSDKNTVIDHSLKVMEGINQEGIISVVKHFPGHGDTNLDSHVDLPVIEKDLPQLEELELTPFIEAIREGVDGIMVAHILFPKLDEEFPSTLSEKIISQLLRKRLGYEGLIFSDDMTMGAIMKNYSIEDAASRFLKAGGDILLICHGYENHIKVFEQIKEEVKKGNLSEGEIDEKLYRIIGIKNRYKLEDKILEGIDLELLNSETQQFLDKIDQ